MRIKSSFLTKSKFVIQPMVTRVEQMILTICGLKISRYICLEFLILRCLLRDHVRKALFPSRSSRSSDLMFLLICRYCSLMQSVEQVPLWRCLAGLQLELPLTVAFSLWRPLLSLSLERNARSYHWGKPRRYPGQVYYLSPQEIEPEKQNSSYDRPVLVLIRKKSNQRNEIQAYKCSE